jgi:hypothetical protein
MGPYNMKVTGCWHVTQIIAYFGWLTKKFLFINCTTKLSKDVPIWQPVIFAVGVKWNVILPGRFLAPDVTWKSFPTDGTYSWLQNSFELATAHKVRRRKKSVSMTRDSGASSFQLVQIAPAVDRINRQTRGARSGLPSLQRLAPSGSQTPQTFVLIMEDIVEDKPPRTAVTQFDQRGITGDSAWFTYKDGHYIRIAYSGYSPSLSFLL